LLYLSLSWTGWPDESVKKSLQCRLTHFCQN
jgi:hypothetical protein